MQWSKSATYIPAMIPQLCTTIGQSKVSVARMNNFLNTAEMDPYVQRIPETGSSGDGSTVTLCIKDGTFAWTSSTPIVDCTFRLVIIFSNWCSFAAPDKEDEKHFVLHDINLTVKRCQLIAIVGPVGCGKTTLLSAFLGQLVKLKGEVSVRGLTQQHICISIVVIILQLI